MTTLAAASGLLDSEFIHADNGVDMDDSGGLLAHSAGLIATGGPRSVHDTESDQTASWVAMWVVTTLGGYLLVYAVAAGALT